MRIKGHQPGLPRGTVELPRPDRESLVLMLSAQPYGFRELVASWIPDPAPPAKGVAIDPRTKKPLIDEDTGRPLNAYNWHDPGYLRELRRVRNLRGALYIAKALENDPNVEFAARLENDDWTAYAEQLHKEISEYGFSEGDLALIQAKLLEVSNMTPARLHQAVEGFLPEAPRSASRGSSPTTQAERSTT